MATGSAPGFATRKSNWLVGVMRAQYVPEKDVELYAKLVVLFGIFWHIEPCALILRCQHRCHILNEVDSKGHETVRKVAGILLRSVLLRALSGELFYGMTMPPFT
jgi:hypothetical protein